MKRNGLLVSLIGVIAILGPDCAKEANIHPHAVAIEKQQAGDWIGAIEEWTRVIGSNPTDAAAYHSRGYCKKRHGDYRGAISDYSKSIEIAPAVADSYGGRGEAYILAGDTLTGCKDIAKSVEMGYKRAAELQAKFCK